VLRARCGGDRRSNRWLVGTPWLAWILIGLPTDPAIADVEVHPPPDIALPRYDIVRSGYAVGEVLRFEFGWQGIPAAQGEVVTDMPGSGQAGKIVVSGKAWTKPWLRWLWDMRDHITAVFSVPELEPVQYRLWQQENADRIETRLTFDTATRVAYGTRVKNGKRRVRAFPYQQSYDPVSAVMVLRSVNLTVGEEMVAEVLTGKSRYLAKINVVALETVSIGATEYPAYRLEPRFEKILAPGARPQPPKVRRMTVWISADERRLPLRIESEVFVGAVYCELVAWERRER